MNKFKFIQENVENLNKKEKNQKQDNLQKRIEKVNWMKIDNKTIGLIEKFLKEKKLKIEKERFYSEEQENKFQLLEQYNRKFICSVIFSNSFIMTLAIRYLDMTFRVKLGGLIYCTNFIYLFFKSNSLLKNYFIIETFNNFLINETKCPQTELKNLKKKEILKQKENIYIQKNLNKFWKEPMAWH